MKKRDIAICLGETAVMGRPARKLALKLVNHIISIRASKRRSKYLRETVGNRTLNSSTKDMWVKSSKTSVAHLHLIETSIYKTKIKMPCWSNRKNSSRLIIQPLTKVKFLRDPLKKLSQYAKVRLPEAWKIKILYIKVNIRWISANTWARIK